MPNDDFDGFGQDFRVSLNYEFSGIPLVSLPVMHSLLHVHRLLYLISDLAAFENNFDYNF